MSLIEIARKTVEKAEKLGARQAEVTVAKANSALTRYTHNAIHQNVAWDNYSINIEVVIDKNKLGTTMIKSFEDTSIDKALETALQIARISTPDPDFVSYTEPKTIKSLPEIYVKKTANVTPEDRVQAVQTLIETALDYDNRVTWSVGAYQVDDISYAVANSLGVAAATKYTRASVDITTKAGDDSVQGSGYRSNRSLDVSEFNFEEMAKESAKDAINGIKPQTIPIGEYEAILTPAAVSTFTGNIGRLGFSARAYQDGYSFITDKIGSQVFDEKLTIVDKGRSLETYSALPFDGDGTPKGTLSLVNKGVAENLCYDNYTALKDGTESTGHASLKSSGGFFRGYPSASNMIMTPGNSTMDELIEDTKRGVLLTRLHYVNPIRRDKAVISGLTRDACWLVENGEIKHPIKVMRFTDAVPRVMSAIDIIGGKSTVKKLPGGTLPAIKVAGFKFTGQSEF